MPKSAFQNNRKITFASSGGELTEAGTYRINGELLGLPNSNYGMLVVFHSGESETRTIVQLFFWANLTKFSFRHKWVPNQIWSDWTTL